MKRILILLILGFGVAPHGLIYAKDISALVESVEEEFEDVVQQSRKERHDRAEAKKRNARSSPINMCYSLDNEDAKHACLKEPYVTKNEDSRNILLGFCGSLSRRAQELRLDFICHEKSKTSCNILDDSEASYACQTCDDTVKWLATFAAGTLIRCYR